MNKIRITDKYWITSDSRCWMISEYKGKRTSKETGKESESWINYTYHGTFDHAVKSLTQRLLREASTHSVGALRDAAKDIGAILEKAVKQAEVG